jgi:pimeloyl-ACP methyl ester carboxylesterase
MSDKAELINQTNTLPDGRLLGYAEYGAPDGQPLFFFHGQPGNRLFRHPDNALTASLGVRLICIDRPGYGLSTFQKGRKILDWPEDVLRLADALGVEKFSVMGFSAGGPYALACAYKIPERLEKVIVVGSPGPMNVKEVRRCMHRVARLNYLFYTYARPLFYLSFYLYWPFARRNPLSFLEMVKQQTPEVDLSIISDPQVFQPLLDSWVENLRVSSYGYAYDGGLGMKGWGFDVGEITKEVHLYWGAQDAEFITRGMGYLAHTLPNGHPHPWPDQAHFGWIPHWAEMISGLE